MNHPMIIDAPQGAKDRAVHLLQAMDFGLYPQDGSRSEEVSRAEADMDVIEQATVAVLAAENDFAAHRAAMGAVARLLGVKRYGVASGRFASVRGPEPIYAATLAALPVQRSTQNGGAL